MSEPETAITIAEPGPESVAPTATDRAAELIARLSEWRPRPSKVRLLIARAQSRLATDKQVAEDCGLKPKTLDQYKREDQRFRELFTEATYDEEIAVLLLSYLTVRGAHATIYRAVNGDTTLRRANIQAAESVLNLAERRRRAAQGANPLADALKEALT